MGWSDPDLSEQLPNRLAFSNVCDRLKIDRAVEVGTDKGVFADNFLSAWAGRLWCVDPWEPYSLPDYDPTPWNQKDCTPDMMMAVVKLAQYADRCRLLRMTSAEAAPMFHGYGIGFVYIDGSHLYEDVRDDMRIWWDVLIQRRRPKGAVLAGHDWPQEQVQQAVREFAEERRLQLHITMDLVSSWYFYKVR